MLGFRLSKTREHWQRLEVRAVRFGVESTVEALGSKLSYNTRVLRLDMPPRKSLRPIIASSAWVSALAS